VSSFGDSVAHVAGGRTLSAGRRNHIAELADPVGGRISRAHFAHGRVADATAASAERSTGFAARTTGVAGWSNGAADPVTGAAHPTSPIALPKHYFAPGDDRVNSLVDAFLTRFVHVAARRRRVAGSHARLAERTIGIEPVRDTVPRHHDRIAPPFACVADNGVDVAELDERVADATGALAGHRDDFAHRTMRENLERSIAQRLARSMHLPLRVRPSVGRRAGAGHLIPPIGARPPDGMKENRRVV
jgi:hypothetical protein